VCFSVPCRLASVLNSNIVHGVFPAGWIGPGCATMPKLSVTSKLSASTWYSAPTGKRTGTTNQSLPKVSANSVTAIRIRSVTPASAPAKLTLPSSNSQ